MAIMGPRQACEWLGVYEIVRGYPGTADPKRLLVNACTLLDVTPAQLTAAENEKVLQTMYGVLSILDAKTSSLLSFNGIVIAACSILLAVIMGPDYDTGWPSDILFFALVGVMILALLGCIISLRVVQVSWPFLQFEHGISPELEKLSAVAALRESRYTSAWKISLSSVLFLMLILVVWLLLTIFVL